MNSSRDLLIIGIWFIVLNGIYVGLHFYNQWQHSGPMRKEENRIKSGRIPFIPNDRQHILGQV